MGTLPLHSLSPQLILGHQSLKLQPNTANSDFCHKTTRDSFQGTRTKQHQQTVLPRPTWENIQKEKICQLMTTFFTFSVDLRRILVSIMQM